MRNLQESVLLWYFGGGITLYCYAHGASCSCSAIKLFVSMVLTCGGGVMVVGRNDYAVEVVNEGFGYAVVMAVVVDEGFGYVVELRVLVLADGEC
jgi:hypothetical protein